MTSRSGTKDPKGDRALDTLVASIQIRLDRLDREHELPEAEGSSLCAELRDLLFSTLRSLSRGDLRSPGHAARALDPLAWFVEKHLPDPDFSRVTVARELSAVLGMLRLAADAADLPAFEAEVNGRLLSPTHRAVLLALFNAAMEGTGHLRCADVRRRSKVDVSEQRVGQVLRQLHQRRLVVKTPWPAQGGGAVPFYSLTEAGLKACERAGLVPTEHGGVCSPFQSVPEGKLESGDTQVSAEPRRPVVAFASTHGGLGTSLAAAHVITLLHIRSPGARVLAIDLDVDSPDLARVLSSASSSGPASRGIYGLLLDHHQGGLRGPELREAVNAATVPVAVPGSDVPLSLLAAGKLGARDQERARNLLVAEVSSLRSGGLLEDRPSFVLELRRAIQTDFAIAVVDTPPTVRDPYGAYLGMVLLADFLVFFARPFSADAEAAKAAIRSFLSHDPLSRNRPYTSILPVLARLDPANEEEALAAYFAEIEPERSALQAEAVGATPPVRLYENGRLSRGTLLPDLATQRPPHSALYTTYRSLEEWVSTTAKSPYLSSIVGLVNTYFGSATPEDQRRIARGMITNLGRDYMPQVLTLMRQRFADEAQPRLENLREALLSAWDLSSTVRDRGRAQDWAARSERGPDSTPPPPTTLARG